MPTTAFVVTGSQTAPKPHVPRPAQDSNSQLNVASTPSTAPPPTSQKQTFVQQLEQWPAYQQWQWLVHNHGQGVRPWPELWDRQRFGRLPRDTKEGVNRLRQNLRQYQWNYGLFMFGLLALMHGWLLVMAAIGLVAWWWWWQLQQSGRFAPGNQATWMVVANRPITGTHVFYGLVGCTSLVFLWILGESIGGLLWTLGWTGVLVVIHAAVMIERPTDPDAEDA